jgi:hypothetical protein
MEEPVSLESSQDRSKIQLQLINFFYNLLRFQVLTAASMMMAVFWDIAPCSLVEVYRCFRGALMMETVSTSETSVNSYQTTRRKNPKYRHLLPYLNKCSGLGLSMYVTQE